MNSTFRQAGLIIIIAIIAAFSFNAISPRGIGFKFQPQAEVPQSSFQVIKEGEVVPLFSLQQTKEVFQMARGIFIDVREKEEFLLGHIPGAINLSWPDFDKKFVTEIGRIPRSSLIIVYGDKEKKENAFQIANRLHQLGFRNVKAMAASWTEWKEASYPLEGTLSHLEGGRGSNN